MSRPRRLSPRALGHPGKLRLHVLGSVPGQCPACPALCEPWHLPKPYLRACCGAGTARGAQLPRGREKTLIAAATRITFGGFLHFGFLARQKRETSPRVGSSLTFCSFTEPAHWADTGAVVGAGGHEASRGWPQTGAKPE